MDAKKIYLTKEGLETLKKEYEELSKKKRPEVLEMVSQSRNQGDLAENAEYQAAREELSFIDGRIDELEEMLKQVVIIEDTSVKSRGKKTVDLGTTVTLHVRAKKNYLQSCWRMGSRSCSAKNITRISFGKSSYG